MTWPFSLPITKILALAVLPLACARTLGDGPTTAAPTNGVVAATEALPPSPLSKVQFLGRVAFTPSGQAQYAWSGAGLRVRFSGRGLVVQMDDAGRYHTVVVDGALRPRLETQKGVRRYTLVNDLAPGEHVVELYRRTEAFVGMTTVIAIDVVNGQLLDMPNNRRHVEVIGDSISCGYGNEGADTSCHFSPETENHYLTYGALLARHFDAQLSTTAWSGRGVVKNYNGEPGEFMPDLYKRILPERPEVTKGLRPPADLVIVNLGTNDFSTEPDPSEQAFVAGYAGLLGQIRSQSPNAYILTTIGPMLGGADLERAEKYIREAVARRVRAGDSRVAYHKMRTPNDAPACDWHPSLKTHELIAEEIEAPIAKVLKW